MDASMETPVIARPAASMPPSEAGDSEHVDLALEGMTCAACAVRIEKVLNRLPGTQASVNFATESAGVRFDPARTAWTTCWKRSKGRVRSPGEEGCAVGAC